MTRPHNQFHIEKQAQRASFRILTVIPPVKAEHGKDLTNLEFGQ